MLKTTINPPERNDASCVPLHHFRRNRLDTIGHDLHIADSTDLLHNVRVALLEQVSVLLPILATKQENDETFEAEADMRLVEEPHILRRIVVYRIINPLRCQNQGFWREDVKTTDHRRLKGRDDIALLRRSLYLVENHGIHGVRDGRHFASVGENAVREETQLIAIHQSMFNALRVLNA